jgi:hypothetical protein
VEKQDLRYSRKQWQLSIKYLAVEWSKKYIISSFDGVLDLDLVGDVYAKNSKDMSQDR